jgi:uncharacterized membrane protein YfhO
MEWSGEKKNNMPQQCTYNGVCYYSSTMSADAWNFFQSLGMERYAQRVSTHYTGSQMTDDLFGIKYVLTENLTFENPDERLSITENEDALPLGYLSEKDVLTLDLSEFEKGKEAQKALFNSIVKDGSESYNEAISYLHKNGFNITEFDTDLIKGTVKAEKDGVMLFSIPYDEGWIVKVDGEEIDYYKTLDALITFDIESQGNHEIEFIYRSKAFVLGMACTVSFVLLFAVLVIFEKPIYKFIYAKLYDEYEGGESANDDDEAEPIESVCGPEGELGENAEESPGTENEN